ncbi:unnamed protein product [Gadus morhua 'NCC']
MDEEREEGDSTPKTALSGEHGRRSKAKKVQQERADSPGPSCVSMQSDCSMDKPENFEEGNHQPSKKRRRQERADSPGPSCVSMKSDWSMSIPPVFKDGRPSREERHQERSKVTSAQSVQQHLPELETNQEELADTLGDGGISNQHKQGQQGESRSVSGTGLLAPLSFYRVSPGGGGSSDTLTHLHTFQASFTQEDLLPGVLGWGPGAGGGGGGPPPVALLKRAGGVPLGGPNTSELCMWSESHLHLDGIPRNPHHLERVPGGSSVSPVRGRRPPAGGRVIGAASDLGGSIRMACFFNGRETTKEMVDLKKLRFFTVPPDGGSVVTSPVSSSTSRDRLIDCRNGGTKRFRNGSMSDWQHVGMAACRTLRSTEWNLAGLRMLCSAGRASLLSSRT